LARSTPVTIRPYEPTDLETIKRLTIEGFVGVGVDYLIEQRWPGESPLSWGERKWRGTERDVTGHPEWCFVAELDGRVVGYITTTISEVVKQGHVNDMAVEARLRGRGIGRKLILYALDVFRQHHLTIARIETLSGNAIGAHLYPSVGFELITTQNHYAMRLD
jgi:ribosomal protein S18 acetylase RimI-like enzyme